MRIAILVAGIICTAASFSAMAGADPSPGHGTRVLTQTPPMLCEIGSDDEEAGIGPNVVCQGDFPQSPPEPCPSWPGQQCSVVIHQDQAIVTASGDFSYRDANIGVGDHPTLDTLTTGQTYHIQGWTIAASEARTTFTNDGTGHGMTIGSDRNVTAF